MLHITQFLNLFQNLVNNLDEANSIYIIHYQMHSIVKYTKHQLQSLKQRLYFYVYSIRVNNIYNYLEGCCVNVLYSKFENIHRRYFQLSLINIQYMFVIDCYYKSHSLKRIPAISNMSQYKFKTHQFSTHITTFTHWRSQHNYKQPQTQIFNYYYGVFWCSTQSLTYSSFATVSSLSHEFEIDGNIVVVYIRPLL